MHTTGVTPPKGIWWKPAHRSEKVWFTIAFIWCLILFAMMPFWHLKGGQNPSGIRSRVNPADYQARVQQFIKDYQVGTDNGIPVVSPPPGSDIYLMGQMWQWSPVLQLQEGAQYTLHLSSLDVNHGFNLFPFNVNFQVVPGYDYALRITPTEAGDFRIVCNEFCGVGHHLMLGKIVVQGSETALEDGDVPATTGGEQ
ncbi:MAG: cytochrome C oxidase subunit II [Gemmatimonadota bacterium]